jgi:hypothetical protein
MPVIAHAADLFSALPYLAPLAIVIGALIVSMIRDRTREVTTDTPKTDQNDT